MKNSADALSPCGDPIFVLKEHHSRFSSLSQRFSCSSNNATKCYIKFSYIRRAIRDWNSPTMSTPYPVWISSICAFPIRCSKLEQSSYTCSHIWLAALRIVNLHEACTSTNCIILHLMKHLYLIDRHARSTTETKAFNFEMNGTLRPFILC